MLPRRLAGVRADEEGGGAHQGFGGACTCADRPEEYVEGHPGPHREFSPRASFKYRPEPKGLQERGREREPGGGRHRLLEGS